MVVHRRAVLMGVVTVSALAAAVLYLVRFWSTHGLVPFLLACALLVIAVVHGIAWRESRLPLLTVDMTGLMVRLGGRWIPLPWNDIEHVEVAARGRLGDGRVIVQPRDERRALAANGPRSRVAALVNRWLYDAALVVPFGLTARASVDDINATLLRLADGRVPVTAAEHEAAEPAPTVALSGSRRWSRGADTAQVGSVAADAVPPGDEPAGTAEVEHPEEPARPVELMPALEPAPEPQLDVPEPNADPVPDGDRELVPAGATAAARDAVTAGHRRLSAVVSALRSPGILRGHTSRSIAAPPATAGALALTDPLALETEPLPELQELRRRAPEDEPPDVSPSPDVSYSATRSVNVEHVIDATADLSAGAMRGIRERPVSAVWVRDPEEHEPEVALAASSRADHATAERRTSVKAPVVSPAAVTIGERIHQARERLDVSVDDLADRTRIRPYVIESIEIGDFSPCGGDFYARGHLRMLSGVLGIDPQPLLSSYDENLASAPVSPRAVFDAELSKGVVRPTGSGSRWGALVAAVLVLLLVWGIARIVAGNESGDAGSAAPVGAVEHVGGAANGADLTITELQSPPPEPTRVVLRASAGSSRVVVWDVAREVVYQGMLDAGDTQVVAGQAPLRLMAVDAGAIEVSAPGHPRAEMGEPGERVFLRIT